jgi:quercetin dioxygenase-like cupin family protein
MCGDHFLRFVTSADAKVEWLSRADLTGAKQIQVVRVTMPPGQAHRFHRHPGFEEVLVFLSGRAEQWIGTERRIVNATDSAFVPTNEVHGTYNIFDEPLVFLAILSPATYDGPALIDVSNDAPWNAIRKK